MKYVNQAVVKFLKSTTLHGFKYLMSRYNSDRIGWALCCVASACCAGLLFVVLWDRFRETPALLQLRSLFHDPSFEPIPTIGFCQPPDVVARTFLQHLKTNGENTSTLPGTFANIIQGKNVDEAQVDLLEEIFSLNNVTVLETLREYTPECSQLIKKCRWRDVIVECDELFKKELASIGICCVATPSRLFNIFIPVIQSFDEIKKLDVGLEATTGNGFEFFTHYNPGDFISPTRLLPGYNYLVHLTFSAEKDDDVDNSNNMRAGICIKTKGYSKRQCQLKCAEKSCGCSDPLQRLTREENEDVPPPCPLRRLRCLRAFREEDNKNIMCTCVSACQYVMAKIVTEQGLYSKHIHTSLDPIYSGLNRTHSVVVRMAMNFHLSKFFLLKSNETWLTLLSSLGGVFNMFLGVGLFSALEFVFFLLIKLPIALRRSLKITPPAKADRVR